MYQMEPKLLLLLPLPIDLMGWTNLLRSVAVVEHCRYTLFFPMEYQLNDLCASDAYTERISQI